MGNQFSPWSDFELNQLRELAGQFSAVHISAQIGRSVEGVRKQIKKQGLKSFVSTPPKPHPVRPHKPVTEPKEVKAVQPKPIRPVAPVKPKFVRESTVKNNPSFPPLEWCPTCHSPVSNWGDHSARLGCKRPAA
jgi:hypothetical protein